MDSNHQPQCISEMYEQRLANMIQLNKDQVRQIVVLRQTIDICDAQLARVMKYNALLEENNAMLSKTRKKGPDM